MRRLLLAAALVLLMVPGCASYQEDYFGDTWLAQRDPGFRKIGDWTVICLGGKLNAVGRVDLEAHCRVDKYDFTAVAKVDRHGPRIITNIPASILCKPTAHAGVDGQPIEGLPLDEQLEIMSRGSVFARETWSYVDFGSYCINEIEETTLKWFSQAYNLMLERWNTFRQTIVE